MNVSCVMWSYTVDWALKDQAMAGSEPVTVCWPADQECNAKNDAREQCRTRISGRYSVGYHRVVILRAELSNVQ